MKSAASCGVWLGGEGAARRRAGRPDDTGAFVGQRICARAAKGAWRKGLGRCTPPTPCLRGRRTTSTGRRGWQEGVRNIPAWVRASLVSAREQDRVGGRGPQLPNLNHLESGPGSLRVNWGDPEDRCELAQAPPWGAGKNQASHSICSHPACSFTLVASACPGEDVAPAATSSKDSWAPGCRHPPPQPLALRLDDLLFPGCWEITGGEGLTGAQVELASHPGNSASLLAEGDSERCPASCCCLVTRLLVLDWLWGL